MPNRAAEQPAARDPGRAHIRIERTDRPTASAGKNYPPTGMPPARRSTPFAPRALRGARRIERIAQHDRVVALR
ncbi:hypothetical protein, partial [Burkholderia cenocepacia]|uniref:hypothetical protein n=1 Tax=Burkholderia cenocepacia TaxID=95486 RepID=UPI001B8FAA7A